MRKRTNALRRKYQSTTGNEALREIRRNQYSKARKEYQTAIRREKTRSWKQYCTTTSPINPWNEVYKLATSKARNRSTVETLQKPDGSKTINMEETLKLMLDLMIPEDHPQDHKAVRRQVERPINTTDDKEFTHEEVKHVIEGFKSKKAPGPNGITNEILKLIFKAIPKTMTALYN